MVPDKMKTFTKLICLIVVILLAILFRSKFPYFCFLSNCGKTLNIKEVFQTLATVRNTTSVDCSKLINGKIGKMHYRSLDKEWIKHKLEQSKMFEKEKRTKETAIGDWLTDCQEYKSKRGYLMHTITEEEKHFPLAFSLLIHNNILQAETLLRAIYRPQNFYCIHVDQKATSEMKKGLHAIAECFQNVFIAKQQHNVMRGTVSVVAAEITCMDELMMYRTWQYLINLTGQDLPLKTNLQMVRILKVLNYANDVNGWIDLKKLHRVEYRYDNSLDIVGIKSPPPFNVTILMGSRHFALHRYFVSFVCYNQRAHDLLEWVKDTLIPDETFFSTLNGNLQLDGPGAYTGTKESMKNIPFLSRYKLHPGGSHNCSGYYQGNDCVFGLGDLPLLAKSWQLFGRKFDQNLAYNCMDDLLFTRTRDEYLGLYKFDLTFYKTLPQVYK